jgi:hypothetical protein
MTPELAVGDRVEYGSKARPWIGTIVEVRGKWVDVQWDHCEPGDVDVAVDSSVRMGFRVIA